MDSFSFFKKIMSRFCWPSPWRKVSLQPAELGIFEPASEFPLLTLSPTPRTLLCWNLATSIHPGTARRPAAAHHGGIFSRSTMPRMRGTGGRHELDIFCESVLTMQ
jgi:hypothetical protein